MYVNIMIFWVFVQSGGLFCIILAYCHVQIGLFFIIYDFYWICLFNSTMDIRHTNQGKTRERAIICALRGSKALHSNSRY